jgi:hypothetical protein
MRFRAKIGIMALVAGLVLASGGTTSAQATTTCTWGGTPAAPTGLITFSPGVTNTPSTGPTQFMATGELAGGAGCTGKLTFTGYADAGNTCTLNAPLHAKATGFPPIKRVEAPYPGVAGSQAVLLYDSHDNLVGSEQAQFLTAAATDPNDPGYMACNTPEGLTSANWSDTLELFAP